MLFRKSAFLLLLAPLALGCGDDERSRDNDGDGGSAGAGGTTPEPPGGDVLSVTVVNGTFGPLQAVGSSDGVIIATHTHGGSINAETLANVPGVFLARLDERGEPNRVWQWERQTDYSVSFSRLWPTNDGSIVIGCSVSSLSGAFYRPVSDAGATPVSVQEPCFARVTGDGTLVAAGELPAPPTWNNKPTGTDSFVLDETGGAIVLINGPDPDADDPEVQNIVLARYDAAGALLGTAFYGSGPSILGELANWMGHERSGPPRSSAKTGGSA